MRALRNTIITLSAIALFSSCEDVVDINLDQGESQLTVEAIITNDLSKQTIYLRETIPYFDNINNTPLIDSGTVFIVSGSNDTFEFSSEGNGEYGYQPTVGKNFEVGEDYKLTVQVGGEEYYAETSMTATAQYDSLTYEFREERLQFEEGYYIEMHAIDRPEKGNTYWVRTFRNDTFLQEADYINWSYDGGFSPGEINGEEFIYPVRYFSINVLDDPYKLGENVRVEILSIPVGFYYFLQEMQTQMLNEGLFATPPANVRTNIQNVNESGRKGTGFFITSDIATKEVDIL
jgi:hypothetical protein